MIIEPDSRLKPEQRAIIEHDFGMRDGRLVIDTRGALVQYVLQRYHIDRPRCTPRQRPSRSWWPTWMGCGNGCTEPRLWWIHL